jgi:hypothetical protein
LIAEENADRRFGAPLGASERVLEREGANLQPQLLVRKKRRKRKGGRG